VDAGSHNRQWWDHYVEEWAGEGWPGDESLARPEIGDELIRHL
jgi:hypothetical protein